MEWMGKFSACPTLGSGGGERLCRAGSRIPAAQHKSYPDLPAAAASRYFPLHGISFHSFLINASVEAALPLQPQQDVEGWIPSVLTPEKIHQAFSLGPGLEEVGEEVDPSSRDSSTTYDVR